jgi:predicted O-linked N-acetylglucosamine transferase (SPINDLY family)
MGAYVAKAVHLAAYRDELVELRQRLLQNRERMPLFDVSRFARHLESAYETIWARYCRGQGPKAVDIPALPGAGARGG